MNHGYWFVLMNAQLSLNTIIMKNEESSVIVIKMEEPTEEKAPEIEANIEDTEEDIEKEAPAPKQRKPRTEKQKQAFEKARLALAEKRKKDKERKESTRKPRGRPKKEAEVHVTPPPVRKMRGQGGRKQTQVIIDDEYSDTDSEPEQIVVRTKKRKPKVKRAPQIIYLSESSDEDYEDYSNQAPPDPFASMRFV